LTKNAAGFPAAFFAQKKACRGHTARREKSKGVFALQQKAGSNGKRDAAKLATSEAARPTLQIHRANYYPDWDKNLSDFG